MKSIDKQYIENELDNGNPIVLLLSTLPEARRKHYNVVDGLLLNRALEKRFYHTPREKGFDGWRIRLEQDQDHYVSINPKLVRKVHSVSKEGKTRDKITLEDYGWYFGEYKYLPMALQLGKERGAHIVQVGYLCIATDEDDKTHVSPDRNTIVKYSAGISLYRARGLEKSKPLNWERLINLVNDAHTPSENLELDIERIKNLGPVNIESLPLLNEGFNTWWSEKRNTAALLPQVVDVAELTCDSYDRPRIRTVGYVLGKKIDTCPKFEHIQYFTHAGPNEDIMSYPAWITKYRSLVRPNSKSNGK